MIINGVTVAEPTFEGIKVTDKIMRASNTGYSISGKHVGDIIAVKAVVDVEWEVLTYSDFEAIRAAVLSAPYFSITYPRGSTTETKTVFIEEVPRTFYSPCKQEYYKGIKITFTEQ